MDSLAGIRCLNDSRDTMGYGRTRMMNGETLIFCIVIMLILMWD